MDASTARPQHCACMNWSAPPQPAEGMKELVGAKLALAEPPANRVWPNHMAENRSPQAATHLNVHAV